MISPRLLKSQVRIETGSNPDIIQKYAEQAKKSYELQWNKEILSTIL